MATMATSRRLATARRIPPTARLAPRSELVDTTRYCALVFLLIAFVPVCAAFLPPAAPSASLSSFPSSPLRATWSDSKAVQDYQAFLASGRQEIELKEDGASVIVRPSSYETPEQEQVVRALHQMGIGDDVVVTPDQTIPGTLGGRNEFPIYVAVPPTQLSHFLSTLNPSLYDKVDDMIFVSGGMTFGNIEDVLKEKGYCRDSMTQVLISGMRVVEWNGHVRVEDATVGLGTDSYGEAKTAGTCSACGKWKGAVAERLRRSNVACDVDFYREWRRKMWERSVLDAVFTLLGAVRDAQPTTVKDVALYYEAEAADILWEMSGLLRGWKALTLMYGFEERLFAVAEKISEPCRLDSSFYPYCWGNFVFLQSKTFCEYLQYAQQYKQLLPGADIPVRDDADFVSTMRQGNLRADGVI